MSSEDKVLAGFGLIKSSIRHIRRRSMRLGRYNSSGVLETTINADLPANYVWVFDPQGDRRISSPAKNLSTEYGPGIAVIVAYNVDSQEDDVIGVDTVLAPLENGTAAAGLNSAQKGASMSTPVSARDIVVGGVFADSSGGLNVRVGAEWHEGGYYADSTPLTLVPTATSSKKSFAVVGVNRLTNAATFTLTGDRNLSASLITNNQPSTTAITDIMAVVAADPEIDWRGAVELRNGDTTINPAKILPLPWLKAVMVGADGVDAGLSGLVPTPAATDNVKALIGNATWQSVIKADGTVAMTGDLNLNANDLANAATVLLNEGSAPSTPASGKVILYAKTDGKPYSKDDAGTEYDLTGGGGSSYYQTIRNNGAGQTQRGKLNAIPGTNITFGFADDAGNDETEWTINAGSTPGGGAPPSICEGRLTLTSGTPITTTDVTAAGTVYFAPYRGNYIGLYSGSAWELKTFSELSISLSGLLPHSIHDVFIYNNSGTPTLELTAWTAGDTGAITGATNATPIVITTSGTAPATGTVVTISGVGGNTAANGTFRVTNVSGTTFSLQTLAAGGANVAGSGAYTSGGNWYKANYSGSRATALTTQDGIYVKTGATTRRYLGAVRITSTAGQTEDSSARCLISNYYNPVSRRLKATDTVNSHTYTTATLRAWNNDWLTRCEFIVGVSENRVRADVRALAGNSAGGAYSVSVGIDSTSSSNADMIVGSSTAAGTHTSATYSDYPGVGYHYAQWLQISQASGTTTWYGDVGLSYFLSGMTVEVLA